MPWPARALALLIVALVLGASASLRADVSVPYWLELEGRVGSRPVVVMLNVRDRQISGNYSYAFHAGQLALAGELGSSQPAEGRVSCRFEEQAGKARVTGEFVGSCDFSVVEGTPALSFEGRWVSANRRRVEPVSLGSRRSLEVAALARYAAVLPMLAPPAAIAAPAGCASVPSVEGVARWRSRTFILHARHFACVEPPFDGDYQVYVAALSEIDDRAVTPVLLRTLPIAHPHADASDVVEFDGSLVPFALASDVLGLAVTAGGTISGSGQLSASAEHIVAFPAVGEPKLLLSFQASTFGKSSMSEYGGSSAELLQLELDGVAPAELVIRTSSYEATDGEEQPWPERVQSYRLRSKPLRLVPLPGRPPAAALARARLIRGGPFSMDGPR